MRSRRIASVALAVVGAVLLIAGLLAFYAREEILEPEPFADRAVAALEDDDVRDFVGDQIVVNLIDRGSSDLLLARPLLETVVRTAIDTDPFERLFRRAALEANRVLFERERESVAFELSDVSQVVRFGLERLSPEVADEVPREVDLALVRLKEREFARETLAIADDVRLLGLALPIAALVLFALAVVVAPDRRVGVLRVAAAAATGAATLAALMVVLRERTLAGAYGTDETTDAEIRAALDGVFDAFLGDLFAWAVALAIGGIVVAAAAALLDPEDVRSPLTRLRQRLARPAGRAGRLIWGLGLVALGILIAADPDASVELVVFAVAALLLFTGASELLVLLGGPGDRAEAERERHRALVRGAATGAAVVAAVTVAALIVTESAGDPDEGSAFEAGTCNGTPGLCDLRLDEALFGGTHNSFSAADSPGWFIANQRRTIARQLADGVRLLLIDPHYGVGETGKVRTDFDAEGREQNRVARELPPETLDAAQRLAGSLGIAGTSGERDVWLCHSVCELGGTRMSDALAQLRDFLDRYPNEVVIVYVEPFVPPSALEPVFERAGLLDDLARLDPALPMPTLQQLIDAERRVVVVTERGSDPAYPWYHEDDDFIQDTPLGVTSVSELSCELNRGSADSPLLMLNHWADVFPPRVGPNVPFNDEELIRERIRECERERKHPVNLVATDFYDQGGLLDVVDEVNAERVAGAAAGALDSGTTGP